MLTEQYNNLLIAVVQVLIVLSSFIVSTLNVDTAAIEIEDSLEDPFVKYLDETLPNNIRRAYDSSRTLVTA
jgi:hypothetical protein